MKRLANKTIILAGVGPGMGRAMALLFAQHGAQVALIARKPAVIAPTVATINAAGGTALAIDADLTNETQVEAAIAQAVTHFGKLDAYCALAGGFYKHLKDQTEIEPDFFELVLRNHLQTLFWGTRHATPHLKANGGGAILTVAAAYKTLREANIAYSTAKSGVIGFSRTLARELHPHNVRVNSICPGLIRIPSTATTIGAPTQSLQRLGQPEDIAHAALYLVSDESAWVTGQTLDIDGGDGIYGGQDWDMR